MKGCLGIGEKCFRMHGTLFEKDKRIKRLNKSSVYHVLLGIEFRCDAVVGGVDP